ncbi:MAG: hypothetical protein AAF703_02540 [Cyanobacteria bacterium P01_D01_bin.105]
MSYAHTSKSTRYASNGVSSHYREPRVIATLQTIPNSNAPTDDAVKRFGPSKSTVKPQPQKQRANTGAPNTGAPLIVKRYVRWLFGKNTHKKTSTSPQTAFKMPQKAFIVTGSIATLALLAVVPSRGASQSKNYSYCQAVVQSGAEISRGGLSRLVSIPSGATRESVRELIDVPYCLLPVPPAGSKQNSISTDIPGSAKDNRADDPIVTREAYPLAFDPEAWVVVSYAESGYAGYDFIFKP